MVRRNEAASCKGRLRGLSCMRGNSPVQFLGEGTVGTLSSYPTRELVDEARLRLHQRVLVAGEQLEFLHQRAIRLQAAQLAQVTAAFARQEIGVDAIGLGARGLAPVRQRLGV